MHSFENMCNTEQKIDNWAQLSKFFSKMNIPIAQQLIDDVINCKAGAAAAMIEAVYTILTGKTYARKLLHVFFCVQRCRGLILVTASSAIVIPRVLSSTGYKPHQHPSTHRPSATRCHFLHDQQPVNWYDKLPLTSKVVFFLSRSDCMF